MVETILVDRVLPPWVDNSIIVDPVVGAGIWTEVEAEMSIAEDVIIGHLHKTLRDQDRLFLGANSATRSSFISVSVFSAKPNQVNPFNVWPY